MSGSIEYLITPLGSSPEPGIDEPSTDSPNTWQTTKIGVPVPNPLNGFRVKCRYVDEQQAPSGEVVKQYPGFELISQTLECISPSGGDVFVVGTPPEYEDYPEFPTFTAPLEEYPANAYAIAGITDGAAYQYVKVFDQTEFWIIPSTFNPPPPSNPPIVDPSEEVNGDIPLEPYDPENGIYPYKSITQYKPDTRTNVLVTYQLTTTMKGKFAPAPPDPDPPETLTGPGQTITETINITQWVQQSIYDWGPACQWYACRGEYAAANNNYCPVGSITNEYPI